VGVSNATKTFGSEFIALALPLASRFKEALRARNRRPKPQRPPMIPRRFQRWPCVPPGNEPRILAERASTALRDRNPGQSFEW
jgi:hypothetical protein